MELKKKVLIFGLISGAISAAMMLVTIPRIRSASKKGEILGYTTTVLSALLVFFGCVRIARMSRADASPSGVASPSASFVTSISSGC